MPLIDVSPRSIGRKPKVWRYVLMTGYPGIVTTPLIAKVRQMAFLSPVSGCKDLAGIPHGNPAKAVRSS
jgi:hypothetical protein